MYGKAIVQESLSPMSLSNIRLTRTGTAACKRIFPASSIRKPPERFEQLLQDAAKHVEQDPRKPFGVLLNAWNEWTEGCYLLPEERTGTARLETVKRTFGLAKQGWK